MLPDPPSALLDDLRRAGLTLTHLDEETEAMVWLGHDDAAALAAALATGPKLQWVQLPLAGVEPFVRAGILTPEITWTCAKGAYADPVAEHALLLTLACLRHLPAYARARTWGEARGTSLFGLRVVIVGAGGIGRSLIRLLEPFGVEVVAVRRTAAPVSGAVRTVGPGALLDELPGADVVVISAAATAGTWRLIGAAELAAMRPDAVLVNVARGSLVDTDALVAALEAGTIGAAALDVTDPEPLPDGHPLWTQPRALITPHSADTWEMTWPLLTRRIVVNARAFAGDGPFVGVVDLAAGY